MENKVLISHRGNIVGKSERENQPSYIDEAINKMFNVEIDCWNINGEIYLGHDSPQYKIDFNWLYDRRLVLWIHCKNVEMMINLQSHPYFIYFWHENDTMTLTSNGYMWVYPGKQPIKNSIAVLPELNNDDVRFCSGICSDYIKKYKKYESL